MIELQKQVAEAKIPGIDEKGQIPGIPAIPGETPLSIDHAIQNEKRDADRVYTGTHCEPYRALFEKYDWPVEVAMAIAEAESSCVPYAKSPTNDHGVMQINKGLAIYGEEIYDPAFNIEIGYRVKYKNGGWKHWAVYNSGDYLKYLK